MEAAIFIVCAVIVLSGALGVVLSRNPVHSALSLVATLFGIAVLFLNQNAQLLAAVQVIVYTGAIVVLILFVLMLLGVDTDDDIAVEPIVGQRILAVIAGLALLGALLAAVQVIVYTGAIVVLILFVLMLLGVDEEDDLAVDPIVGQRVLAFLAGFALLGSLLVVFITQRDTLVTGQHSATAAIRTDLSNIAQLGRQIFTTWIFAFEITAGLLTVAVIGAVVMARRPDSYEPLPEPESFDDGAYVPGEVEA